MKDAERAAGARETAYARTLLAFATKAGGPAVRAVAMGEVIRTYAGELAEWPDGKPIRVVRRPSSDMGYIVLATASPAMADALAAAHLLAGLGCTVGQGWLFGRAVPEGEATELVAGFARGAAGRAMEPAGCPA